MRFKKVVSVEELNVYAIATKFQLIYPCFESGRTERIWLLATTYFSLSSNWLSGGCWVFYTCTSLATEKLELGEGVAGK